jgi:hypothetical protein
MNLSITGTGAVAPSGWGVAAMMAAIENQSVAPLSHIERPLGDGIVRTPVLRVPQDNSAVPKFPRLRRTSPISKFAAAATMEALGPERVAASFAGELRIGVIFTLTNGCVNYSNRFFGEVLADPSVASPILFPETVFNAPSSHLSAMIGSHSPNDTLVTDGTGFFTGIDLAAEWLLRDDVDGCVVVSSEEVDWLSAEALLHYSRSYIPAEGAGAIYLEKSNAGPRLLHLPDPVSFSVLPRTKAAARIHDLVAPECGASTLWVDGTVGNPRIDAAEESAWSSWNGQRLSPRRVLGESMGAASALQFVAAVESVKSGACQKAVITAVGGNQQAAGAVIGW